MRPLETYQLVLPIVMCLVVAVLATQGVRYRFALLGFGAIVGYAILQDQVSARLCPEYFTVFHNPIPGVADPTLLGVCWGFLGGWWGGILLGYVAGLVATVGPRPQLHPRELVLPLAVLVAVVAGATALTGASVWRHADTLGVALDPSTAELVPVERHKALLVVACYHFVAYGSAAIGGVAVCVWIGTKRRKRGHQGTGSCPPKPLL
ncbi:Uncharacterized protein OS=Blastopirellula marina DSM 3645 GN=DSM3645_00965 PE=4 SV=1 [Gemmata massiliana]|uniref:Uncharacterized protein n=1 Tax=Gemmata massiliana TaxID=1210884 RepID=A0A6P2CXY3_9BACT|nr:hypothetical protein [Gemmata massiliana]VTR93769.1 Uncharacterized protein OS=Blastopirellula marina DSM 3645 GN=DSM3645_00965 PE=4 SV=1 [Gemmata massiliana]